mgnify:CR=1 FL=1
MSNSETGDFYFGISDKKIYICFFEKEKSHYKETLNFEIPDSLNNDLNFKIILNLLKKNIRKMEKNLGFFLNSGNISIQSPSYQKILFSIKNIFDEKILDKKVLTNLVNSSIQKFSINEDNLSIIHIIINKFIIDGKVYKFFQMVVFYLVPKLPYLDAFQHHMLLRRYLDHCFQHLRQLRLLQYHEVGWM